VEVVHTVMPDAWLIPLAGPANRQGRIAAENICGRNTVYDSTQGTSIVKVFNMTAGGTGATEKNLLRAKRHYGKAYLHPSGHAGYYPGTAAMAVKVLFDRGDGRLLGAQVGGFDGVDKRIDVFAMAVRAGLTVYDLEGQELAYAPPFGSAKDPVNMAGFVAANILRGDVLTWYAEEFPEKTASAMIIDVRSPLEFEAGHIPGARNIPLGDLRARLGELPADKPLRLYCKVGFRSYLACRMLVQRGFKDAASLSGGITTFQAWHRSEREEALPPPFLAYAEEQMAAKAPLGRVVEVDCTGLQCPGPIMRLKKEMESLAVGDEIVVRASDQGFFTDAPAWCLSQGHRVVEVAQKGAVVEARIRKGAKAASPQTVAGARPNKKTFVVFSGDLDRVLAAFIIANGALAMGSEVTMFFTFWGLNALRKSDPPPVGKGLMDRMFGMMMPRGANRLKLSNMNMGGMGTAMMKKVMRDKNVQSLPTLMDTAQKGGARIIACTMSMEIMGISREELLDGVELGGVAMFLGEADRSGATLFI
jgi:peroxiredoxin family protein/rhodanese-related sulfurtransferase/TusA-related sulfurtransferase